VIYKERVPSGAAAVNDGYLVGSLFDHMASASLASGTGTGYVNLPMEWQVRAGQLFFPQTSIRGSGTAVGQADTELYSQTLRAFQKLYPGPLANSASSNTSVYNFRGLPSTGARAVYALDLQRSNVLTSGIPLSNSRQLSIFYNTAQAFGTGGSIPYLVDVWLVYQILIRTFLSQAVIEV